MEPIKTTLMQFPCDFPLKVVGKNSESFLDEMIHIIQKYFPLSVKEDFVTNLSKNHQYISITITLHVEDQKTLDALYMELSQHTDTHMVL